MKKTKWEAMTIKQLHPKLIQLNLNQFNKYVSPAFGIFSWIPDSLIHMNLKLSPKQHKSMRPSFINEQKATTHIEKYQMVKART